MNEINQNTEITVAMVSLGCPKNQVDAESMLGKIAQSDFIITTDIDDTDVIIINTCGFIDPAKKEAISEMRYFAQLKEQGQIQKIIATGCLTQRMGEKLLEREPYLDAIVGLGERDNIADIIKESFVATEPLVHLERKDGFVSDDSARLLTTPPHWAYLRISEGCNRKCTFCTIPQIRGSFRSKPIEMLVSEAKELVNSGAKELDLIAQDSNYYGKDHGKSNGLVKLLDELEKIENLEWIRVMYLYPATVTDELIKKIASSKKVLNYFDIPIQHINNEILSSMQRSDTKEKTTKLIERVRETMPDAVIRTTVIVGYPGESSEQFDELIKFIKWAKFDALGCFPYYAEKGTPAQKLKGQIKGKLKQKRVEEVMLTQQKIVFEKNAKLIGKELQVAYDGIDENNEHIGRYYGQAPQIDGVCIIDNCNANRGDFLRTKVIGTRDYDIIVEQLAK